MTQIVGPVSLTLDGALQQVRGDFKYSPDTITREAIVGADGIVQGYKETYTAPYIEGNITDSSNLELQTLKRNTNMTATFKLGSGKIMQLNECWVANVLENDAQEGQIQLRIEGKFAKEIVINAGT